VNLIVLIGFTYYNFL